MAKEELIQLEGLVTEILPDARYRVKLDAGQVIIAYTAGKMKKNRIKTLAGGRRSANSSDAGECDRGRISTGRHGRPSRCRTARPTDVETGRLR